jgi:hypothetical protein
VCDYSVDTKALAGRGSPVLWSPAWADSAYYGTWPVGTWCSWIQRARILIRWSGWFGYPGFILSAGKLGRLALGIRLFLLILVSCYRIIVMVLSFFITTLSYTRTHTMILGNAIMSEHSWKCLIKLNGLWHCIRSSTEICHKPWRSLQSTLRWPEVHICFIGKCKFVLHIWGLMISICKPHTWQ